jgi:hypothetical protein
MGWKPSSAKLKRVEPSQQASLCLLGDSVTVTLGLLGLSPPMDFYFFNEQSSLSPPNRSSKVHPGLAANI